MESNVPFSKIITSSYAVGNTLLTAAKQHVNVIDKYTQASLAAVPLADEQLVEVAIKQAVLGFESMRKSSAGERKGMLHQMAKILTSEKEAFAQLIAAEAGKPITYARAEVERCITTLTLSAEESIRHSGETVPMDFDGGIGKTAFTKRFPLGPIACISPFNFPLNLALHKIAPAIATGCSVIIKPAPQSPLSVLAFAKLIQDENILPTGSLQVFLADNEATEKIVTDDRLKLFSFTGSPQIGWMLKSKAGKKKVVLELGGNAPVIIDASADVQHAAKRCAVGSFLYAGQICISTQRIYVHKETYEAFLSAFLSEVKKLKAGDPRDENVSVGPIIETKHLQRIADWVKEAEQNGAKVLAGGHIIDASKNLFAPTVLTNTKETMKVCQQEVFGPVVLVESISTFEEGIEQSNNSPFGLQAGVFTERIEHLKLAHEQLEVGGVLINDIPGFRIDSMPYGGVKDSGLGREGIKYAMDDMTEPRLLIY